MAGFKPAFPGTPRPPAKLNFTKSKRHLKPLQSPPIPPIPPVCPSRTPHPYRLSGEGRNPGAGDLRLPHHQEQAPTQPDIPTTKDACTTVLPAKSRIQGGRGHPPPTAPNAALLIQPLAFQELLCYYPHMNISEHHNRTSDLPTQASNLPVPLSSHSALNLSSFRPTDAPLPSSSQCLPARKQDTMNQFGTDFLRGPSHSLQTPWQRRRN